MRVRIVTWEAVREVDGGDDLEANTLLATSYQKIGELVASDQAVQRALKNARAEGRARAELLALVGRNAKTRWQKEWAAAGADPRRGSTALELARRRRRRPTGRASPRTATTSIRG